MLLIGSDYVEGLISKMRNFLKSTHPSPSLAPETAQTTLGRRILGTIMGSPDRKFSGLHSPPSGAASRTLSANRRPYLAITIALTAALAVSMWLLLGGLVQAQEKGDTYQYAENGADPVVNFTANDPEDVTEIVWSIFGVNADGSVNPEAFNATGLNMEGQDIDGDGADDVIGVDVVNGGDFTVSDNGALSFASRPNFEVPSGGGPGDPSNTYKVVVQASDGGLTNWVNWFKVTVTVTDVEEEGSVSWMVDPDGDPTANGEIAQKLRQFQAGALLDATVTDPDNATADDDDGPVTVATWKWHRSSSRTGPWTEIFGETAVTYTASDEAESDDVGMYLRAVATYTDRRGGTKLADFVSLYPVQEAKEINTDPEFPSAEATRSISEGPSGRAVGTPVTATDEDNDVLNYGKVDGGDAALFNVNPATGQITTASMLNYEATDDNVFELTIKATDSSGDATGDELDNPDITVMITVTDVNERPMFSAGPEGMATDYVENNADLMIGTYTATDPEGGEIDLSLSGNDSDKFELNDPVDVAPGTKVLAFKEKPDFENPADSDGNNIYEVTVEASDTVNTTPRSITVKVIDADEDGKVELSTQDAVVGRPITASLSDSDGEIARVTWTWQMSTPAAGETCAESAAEDSLAWDPIGSTNAIAYAPMGSDNGNCLRAMAWYMDRTTEEMDTLVDDEDSVDPGDAEDPVRFINTAVSATTTAVRDDPANEAPRFDDGTATVRYVDENTLRDLRIGDPVGATDDDGDRPTYTLSGSDARSFEIDAGTGQLMTKEPPLDHESKSSYTVTVTADDSSGESNSTARITVTIRVVDLDEPPVITSREQPNVPHEGTISHDENDPGVVANFTARDPEGVTPIVWSLLEDATENEDIPDYDDPDIDGGEDDIVALDIAHRDSFLIDRSSGALKFRSPPDFEADDNGDNNSYRVVVQASDGGRSEMVNWYKITVTVADMEEPGRVTWTVDPDGIDGTIQVETLPQPLLEFRAGAVLTASVTDDDGETNNVMWRWYRSSSRTSGWFEIAGEEAATYTASDQSANNDVGKYLRVEATYEDGRGGTRKADFVSAHTVRKVLESGNTAPELVSADVATRKVNEGSADANAGGPITGADEDRDVLNYAKMGDAGDNDQFDIDQETGQIATIAGLNFEMPDDVAFTDTVTNTEYLAGTNTYVVTVIAYDSSGEGSDPVTVIITVNDINEDPMFVAPTPAAGSMADHSEVNADLTLGLPDGTGIAASTFTAEDLEGGHVTLTLDGVDKNIFEFVEVNSATPLTHSKMVAFKEKPDFEKPGDRGGDNIYNVTVLASDTVNMASRAVAVKVTDADEDGKVELSTQDAVVGTEIEATLVDSDGDVDLRERVERLSWQWQIAPPAGADNTCALADTWVDISKAGSSAYIPSAGDNEMCLRAMASYMDRTRNEDDVADDQDTVDDADVTDMDFLNTALSSPTTAVRDDPENHAPEFAEAPATVRYVEENNDFAAPETIGDPFEVTDDDGDTVSYSLGGTDMAYFDIEADTGQLMTKARLDHETKDSYCGYGDGPG